FRNNGVLTQCDLHVKTLDIGPLDIKLHGYIRYGRSTCRCSTSSKGRTRSDRGRGHGCNDVLGIGGAAASGDDRDRSRRRLGAVAAIDRAGPGRDRAVGGTWLRDRGG